LQSPKEGDSAKVPKKKGGIANRGEATPDIGYDKNKENDMKTGNAVSIHANPGPDEQHGGTGCSKDIGQEASDAKKEHVSKRGSLALNSDPDSTRDNEERSDQGDKADILFQCGCDRCYGTLK
jgi:hypothetical protein